MRGGEDGGEGVGSGRCGVQGGPISLDVAIVNMQAPLPPFCHPLLPTPHTRTRVCLRPVRVSLITEKGVTSAPVPEVVGMQMHSAREPSSLDSYTLGRWDRGRG